MSHFNISDDRGVRTIQLNRGKANAINMDLVTEMRQIFRETSQDDGVSGVLLTGKEHFFSAGLDIVELYDYDASAFESFWENFMHVIYELTAFDKPMVAAVTGHAPAGGCVFAMTTDYRVMAEGKYKIGLNEVPVGIIVPPSVFHLYTYWIGSRQAAQSLAEGTLHTVEAAHNIGLVDEVAPMSEVNARALAKLETYVNLHQGAWRNTKKNCRKELLHQLEVRRDIHFDQHLDQWWQPEVREMMQEFIDRLKK
ncbi:MAG: enoyl-CoA hydratase/isomerase family protein [Bacteroidetes bacterium]|nr:enoyl-CoA hydratase/isomerase family protein [Bacteroidota bacterium]